MKNMPALVAYTDLSLEEIQNILFDGVEIGEDPKQRGKFQGSGFYCMVSRFPTIVVLGNWVVGAPRNLEVIFHFERDVDGFVNTMKVIMNWFRKTTGYCAYFYNAEIISLVQINGKTIRNSTEHAWFPDEVIELIDIPYEVKDLGIL